MKTVKVVYGQALIDLAIQELGDATRICDIAILNGLSVTDDLQPGSVLLVPDYESPKSTIVQVFATSSNKPASNEGIQYDSLEGIGYWTLSRNFLVS